MKAATTLVMLNPEDVALAAHLAPPEVLARLQYPYCYGMISVNTETHLPCALMIYTAARGDRLDIDWLNVYEDCRGEGLGDELMNAAFQLAADSGLSYVGVRLEGELSTKENAGLVWDYLLDYGFGPGMEEAGDWELGFRDFEESPFYRKQTESEGAVTCEKFGERETKNYLKQSYEKLKDYPLYDYNKALEAYDPALSSVVVKNGNVEGLLLTTARNGIIFPLALEYGADAAILNQLLWSLYFHADEYRAAQGLKQTDIKVRVPYSEKAASFFAKWFPELSAQPVTVFRASPSFLKEKVYPSKADIFGSHAPDTYRWLKNEYYGDVI